MDNPPEKSKSRPPERPSPSPNLATDLLIADIALRGFARLTRLYMERQLAKAKHDPAEVDKEIDRRSITTVMVHAALARIATRSVPGALAVGGWLAGKVLLERRKQKKADALAEKEAQEVSPEA